MRPLLVVAPCGGPGSGRASPGRVQLWHYSGSSSGSNVSGSLRAPMPTPVSGFGISSRGAGRSSSRSGKSPVTLMGFSFGVVGSDQRLLAYHDAAPSGRWVVMVMSLRPSTQPVETPTSIGPAPAGPLSGGTVVVDPLEESRVL